ncbi:unnamed protein product [marine sediment metagenome]|uniref:Uncharacterized protein n=1 Tax=marine sediment metagenome TaxID=412755 RepID=X1VJ73_9ZZZZ
MLKITEMPSRARLYKKRPIPIAAIQIHEPFCVDTLEGRHTAKAGDYLLRGIAGELYCCDKEIFEKSYELLSTTKRSGGC